MDYFNLHEGQSQVHAPIHEASSITESPIEVQARPSVPVAADASQNDSTTTMAGDERDVEVKANTTDSSDEEDSDSDESNYMSFDDSDSDVDDAYPETKEEREAREHERQLVLEAAGLILKQDENVKPPPRPVRQKSKSSKRRPPPLAPRQQVSSSLVHKELPLPPPPDPADHLNDAFDRYEAFRSAHANPNRLSVASVESAAPMSPTVSVVSQPPSLKEGADSRSSYSGFLHFLGRSRTPVESSERKSTLVISAPILNSPDMMLGPGDIQRSGSPAFGSVSWLFSTLGLCL